MIWRDKLAVFLYQVSTIIQTVIFFTNFLPIVTQRIKYSAQMLKDTETCCRVGVAVIQDEYVAHIGSLAECI